MKFVTKRHSATLTRLSVVTPLVRERVAAPARYQIAAMTADHDGGDNLDIKFAP